jgi:hypothetical protein
LAQNPEHRTDSPARSQKVAWSCRPLPRCTPAKPSVRPVVPWRYCVDARSCDSTRTSLVSVVEENLHATLQLDTQHAFVAGVKVGLTSKARGPFICSFKPPQRTPQKGRYRKRIRCSHSNLRPQTVTRLASGKKEQRLVKPITLHMPRRLALVATPSPVLRTDASARSRQLRSRRSRRTASLRSSSASCIAGP